MVGQERPEPHRVHTGVVSGTRTAGDKVPLLFQKPSVRQNNQIYFEVFDFREVGRRGLT